MGQNGLTREDGAWDMPPHPVRVFIVEDHPSVRMGLRVMLGAPDVEVVGEAATGGDAIAASAGLNPHVVILDMRLPDMSGIEVLKALKAADSSPAVLVFTAFPDMLALQGAIENGAAGFLFKEEGGGTILNSVRRIASGALLLDEPRQRQLLKIISRMRTGPQPAPFDLSPREMEVLRALADGLSAEETVKLLGISISTYRTHIRNILEKLGAKDQLHALLTALRKGIVTLE